MNFFIRILIIALSGVPFLTYADSKSDSLGIMPGQSCNDCCGSVQTPVGVMTDHIHPKGAWVVSYTYMNMMMKGNKAGTANLSDNQVYQNYMMSPQTMSMQMHMLMAMYSFTDRLTVMAMGGFVANNMSMNMDQAGMNMMMNMPGMNMGTDYGSSMISKSSGLADTRIYGLYRIVSNCGNNLVGSLGVSLPTGTTSASGMTLLGNNEQLSYAMQIGTGSFGLLPSLTYVRKSGFWSLGAEAGALINMNTNAQGYRWGNTYNATAWAGYRFISSLSASIRAEGIYMGNIAGFDKDIAVLMNNDPNANINNYGGQRVNIYAGLNYSIKKLNGLIVMAEYGIPVYQNLNGPQMSMHGNAIAGIQYMFNKK